MIGQPSVRQANDSSATVTPSSTDRMLVSLVEDREHGSVQGAVTRDQ
jgi:hypothetical protein